MEAHVRGVTREQIEHALEIMPFVRITFCVSEVLLNSWLAPRHDPCYHKVEGRSKPPDNVILPVEC